MKEQFPKIKTPEESEIEKKKFTAAIIDTTDLMKEQAIDVGNEKMTMKAPSEELAKTKGLKKFVKGEYWSRVGQKAWKHGIARDFYRNKEIYKASQEILKSENAFIGEGKDKEDHDRVMSDIIDQFTSGYEETIHKEAGEEKVILNKDELGEKTTENKEAVKQLIKDYATGKITKESFKTQEERLFHDLKESHDEKVIKENTMYASNLLEVAEQIKLAIKNEEFLENEDFEVEVIYGKSKAGVRTQENFNRTERIMDKLLSSKVGQFTNETTIAIVGSCISTLLVRSVATLPGKIVPILGTALISSWIGKKRAETEEKKKRAIDAREKAKGGKEKFNPETMPVRAEMDTFSYKTESANDIIKGINKNLKTLETNPNLTEEELKALSAELASLEALIQLSDRRGIDLVTYSDSTKVVKERFTIDCKRRQIKDAIEKALTNGGYKITNGQDFETYIKSLSTAEENRMISEKDTGIDAKDRAFNKMKVKKGWDAAGDAFVNGVLFGAIFSEISGAVQGHTGVVGDIIHTVKGGHTLSPGVSVEHLTMATYIKHLIQGDIPKMDPGKIHEVLMGTNHMKLPEGVNVINNPDGSFDLVGNGGKVFAEHLTTNSDGTLTEGAKNILAHNGVGVENHLIDGTEQKTVNIEDHFKTHPGESTEVKGRVWLDENTPDYHELNELGTRWGGINGTGIDLNGNYVLDVGHMTPDGSFHGEISVNAQELMKAGKLQMLFSPDGGSHSFPVTFTPEGKIIVPPGSELGKLLFSTVNGHADFHGKFGEIVQNMGDGQYQVLSTIEGKGINDVIEVVKTHTQETLLTVPGSYDGNLLFVPVVPGNPLETLENNKEDKNAVNDKGDKESPIDPNKIDVVPNVVPNVIEDKKIVNEISKEEYDGMVDDLKMLNKKLQTSQGIITLNKLDFKSEYGKKRYEDLKSIPDGKPVKSFNMFELQTIGDEMEKVLINSKIVSRESESELLEKEEREKREAKIFEDNMRADLDMLNEKIRNSNGIITVNESDFKSEYGKKRYDELKSIPDGKPVKSFNMFELQTIGNEIEKVLRGDRKIEEFKIKSGEDKKNLEEKNTEENKEERKIEKENVEAVVDKTEVKEKLFTKKDLSYVGTEFETSKFKYKIVNIKSKGLFGVKKIVTVIVTSKEDPTKQELISYDKKSLEQQLDKRGITIVKSGKEN